MIYTEEVFALEDELEKLSQTILNSNTLKEHCLNKEKIMKTQETQQKEKAFKEARESFERIEAYGEFIPDFKEKKRSLRQAKRELDLDENIQAYRITERELQGMLDRIVYEMAQVVSTDIKIDAGNPFFEFASKGCGGNCHVG